MFGLDLAEIRIAGGLIVGWTAWQMVKRIFDFLILAIAVALVARGALAIAD
jgi:small neutral amino acid transporter SnatA (MarC family)